MWDVGRKYYVQWHVRMGAVFFLAIVILVPLHQRCEIPLYDGTCVIICNVMLQEESCFRFFSTSYETNMFVYQDVAFCRQVDINLVDKKLKQKE
jgi:hypothetical protein